MFPIPPFPELVQMLLGAFIGSLDQALSSGDDMGTQWNWLPLHNYNNNIVM